MNSLTTFNYLSSNIRVVEIDGLALFAASDACAALRYANPTDAIRRHVDPSQVRNLAKREVRDQGFPNRGMTFVTEAGLYDLIFGSTLPNAQEMKHWVTREVLPAIRKDGGYIVGEEKVRSGEMDEDEFVLRAMTILQRKVERLRAEKEAAEAALIAAQPKIDLAERVEKHLRTLSRVARSLEGVNSMKIKSDLLAAGFLYKDHSGTYRVYAKYRQHHFVERFEEQFGKVDIFVGPKGYEVLDALLRDRRLTMLKASA